jgi:nitroimidazol reductase NimA-like FMN-containing flavoprotein (pyridoxamine 5'-phosphate oxidase superfamily)
MFDVAYTQRSWTDQQEIDAFLGDQQVGVLGLMTEEYPYTVPVNFLWLNGSIYFHGLGSGRKIELLASAPPASFTVYAHHGTTVDSMPCHADTSYSSVMIFGTAAAVTDTAEATTALQGLVEKLMPGYYRAPLTERLVENYRSGIDANPVAVYRITPERISAKQNLAEPGELFTASI